MFSIKESIKLGWQKTKENMWVSVAVVFISIALPFLIQTLGNSIVEYKRSVIAFPAYITIIIAVIYLSITLKIGGTKILLRIYDGEKPKIKEMFNSHGLFWRFLGESVLYSLIILVGIILLVVPGIIFAIMFAFASIIIVDTKSGIIDSLKESANITKGSKMKLLGFFIVLGLINMLGYVALGIGVFMTIPISTYAMIHAYRELTKKKAAITTPIDNTPVQILPTKQINT